MRRSPPKSKSQNKAVDLHRTSVVADLHVDTLISNAICGYDLTKRHRNPVPLSPFFFHADLPRVRDAGVDIWGLGLVVSPLFSKKKRFARIRGRLEHLNGVCEKTSGFYVIRTRKDLERGLSEGHVGALPGLEGAHPVGGDLGLVRELFDLGMRYLTLAHFSSNEACHCAMGLGSRRGRGEGLSDFGRKLVDEIHRLGVVLDLAHVNRVGFMEACGRSERPVFVSHTGVCGVHKTWRNIDDEQIEAVAKTGGVVGIMFSPKFLTGSNFAPLQAVADHILHVVKVGGPDCAAYGSDMDGWLTTMPRGFDDMADLPKVTALLLDSGLPEKDVKKIIGGNVKRVLCAVL